MDVWNAAILSAIALALTAWAVVLHRRDPKFTLPASLGAIGMSAAAAVVLVGTHAQTATGVLFYGFALGAIASSYLVVTARHPVHGALWLLVAMACLGGIMILLEAPYLATAYVLVFAAAALVFYLSSVTMVELPDKPAPDLWISRYTVTALAGLASFVLVCVFISELPATAEGESLSRSMAIGGATQLDAASAETSAGSTADATASIGHLLLGEYFLPFLAVALLLVTAIVGGVYLAHYEAPADTRYR